MATKLKGGTIYWHNNGKGYWYSDLLKPRFFIQKRYNNLILRHEYLLSDREIWGYGTESFRTLREAKLKAEELKEGSK